MSAHIPSTSNVVLFKSAEFTTVSGALYNKKGVLLFKDNFLQFEAVNGKTDFILKNILTVSITNNNEEPLRITLFDINMNGYTFVVDDANSRSKQAINTFLKFLKSSSSVHTKKKIILQTSITTIEKDEIPPSFRITNVNSEYKACSHYKSQDLLVPYGFSDESLLKSAQFHYDCRFPVVALNTTNKQCFLTTSMTVVKDKLLDDNLPNFVIEKLSLVGNIEEEALTLFSHSMNVKSFLILKIRYDSYFNDHYYVYSLNDLEATNTSLYNQISNNLQSLKSVISQTAVNTNLSENSSQNNHDAYKNFGKFFKNEKLELPLSPGKLQNCFVSLLVSMGILSKTYFFDQVYEYLINGATPKIYPAVILKKAQSFLSATGTSMNSTLLKEYMSKKQLQSRNPYPELLEMMYLLLKKALDLSCLNSEKPNCTLIVDAICSDYSSVIVSLVNLMTCDKAKTVNGFLKMVVTHWFDAGHPFQARCDNVFNIVDCDDASSPIFLLFLFCVNQLIVIDPLMYEFNENLLFKLYKLVYKYADLKNNEMERTKQGDTYNEAVKHFVLQKITPSEKYTNIFYKKFVSHENYRTYRSVKYLIKLKEGVIPQKMNLYDRFFFNLHCGSRLDSLSKKQTQTTKI